VTGKAASTGGRFSADPASVRWFGDRIVQAATARAPARVLDIGCGDASLLLFLAPFMPAATFVGVDLSPDNVLGARERVEASPARARITIECADYLAFDEGPFDFVVASSSLQGIDATTSALGAKLARDTARGGLLMHLTPYRCAYNTALNMVRRGLRRVRGPAADRAILTAARILHPGQSTSRLRERVDYMYLLLRHDEDGLRAELQRHGFTLVHSEPAPHTSVGQPLHRLAVMTASTRA
jgi:SAM-dependent methyltransferase